MQHVMLRSVHSKVTVVTVLSSGIRSRTVLMTRKLTLRISVKMTTGIRPVSVVEKSLPTVGKVVLLLNTIPGTVNIRAT